MSKRNWGAAFGRAVSTAAGMMQGASFSYQPTRRITNVSYAGGGQAGGVRFSRERHMVGRRKRKNKFTMKDYLTGKATVRARWQLCSNTLTGPGRIPIGFGGYTVTDNDHHSMPVHFMSLTQAPWAGASATVQGKGCYPHGLYKVIRNPSNGQFGYQFLESNTNAGVNNYDVQGNWQPENIPNNWSYDNEFQPETLFHKWTEVKLNLYGAKHIPLVYTINIVKLPKEFSPFQYPPDAIVPPTTGQPEFSEFSRWMEDINRSLLCNPINVTGTKKEYKKHVKLLKTYKINLQPLSYTNAAAEGEAPVKVGNVRQFKIFLRHDRFRNYLWSELDNNVDQDRNFADLGWDVNFQQKPVTDVTWGSRVYMFITCTTGGIKDGPQNDTRTHLPLQASDIPSDYGTYDIIVRNEFKLPDKFP